MYPHTAHGYNSPAATISREIVCSLHCIFLQFFCTTHGTSYVWHNVYLNCLKFATTSMYGSGSVSRLPFISFSSMAALLLQFDVILNISSCNAHACKIGTKRKGTLVVRVKASASGLLSRHTATFLRRRLAAILLGRQRVTEPS